MLVAIELKSAVLLSSATSFSGDVSDIESTHASDVEARDPLVSLPSACDHHIVAFLLEAVQSFAEDNYAAERVLCYQVQVPRHCCSPLREAGCSHPHAASVLSIAMAGLAVAVVGCCSLDRTVVGGRSLARTAGRIQTYLLHTPPKSSPDHSPDSSPALARDIAGGFLPAHSYCNPLHNVVAGAPVGRVAKHFVEHLVEHLVGPAAGSILLLGYLRTG